MKALALKRLILFFLLFFSVLPVNSQTIENIDGVRIVYNDEPKWGDNLKVDVEFVRRIGTLEGTDENYLFFHPFDIAVDGKGNLFVLDNGNYRVQKFDSSRKYIATIGSGYRGNGPGDLQFVGSMDVSKDGYIYLADQNKRAIVVFTPEGNEKERLRLTGHTTASFRFLESGGFIMRTWAPPEGVTAPLQRKLDTQGKTLFDFCAITDFQDEDMNYVGNFTCFNLDEEENIYVTFNCSLALFTIL